MLVCANQVVIYLMVCKKVKNLFSNYLSGVSLVTAAKNAGINTYHCTVKKMLTNRRYLGDEFYPPIIDTDTFEKVHSEITARAQMLGRLDRPCKTRDMTVPTDFKISSSKKHFDDPIKQAEYIYSLIESEL